MTLSYDPKIVEFKTAGEGTLLKKDGQQTSFLFSNNIKAGTVDIYMTRIGDVGGVGGSGSSVHGCVPGQVGRDERTGPEERQAHEFQSRADQDGRQGRQGGCEVIHMRNSPDKIVRGQAPFGMRNSGVKRDHARSNCSW